MVFRMESQLSAQRALQKRDIVGKRVATQVARREPHNLVFCAGREESFNNRAMQVVVQPRGRSLPVQSRLPDSHAVCIRRTPLGAPLAEKPSQHLILGITRKNWRVTPTIAGVSPPGPTRALGPCAKHYESCIICNAGQNKWQDRHQPPLHAVRATSERASVQTVLGTSPRTGTRWVLNLMCKPWPLFSSTRKRFLR